MIPCHKHPFTHIARLGETPGTCRRGLPWLCVGDTVDLEEFPGGDCLGGEPVAELGADGFVE